MDGQLVNLRLRLRHRIGQIAQPVCSVHRNPVKVGIQIGALRILGGGLKSGGIPFLRKIVVNILPRGGLVIQRHARLLQAYRIKLRQEARPLQFPENTQSLTRCFDHQQIRAVPGDIEIADQALRGDRLHHLLGQGLQARKQLFQAGGFA